jgi:hypothetical protein
MFCKVSIITDYSTRCSNAPGELQPKGTDVGIGVNGAESPVRWDVFRLNAQKTPRRRRACLPLVTDWSKMDALNSAPQDVENEDAASTETQDSWFDQWVTAKGEPLKKLVSSMMGGLAAYSRAQKTRRSTLPGNHRRDLI